MRHRTAPRGAGSNVLSIYHTMLHTLTYLNLYKTQDNASHRNTSCVNEPELGTTQLIFNPHKYCEALVMSYRVVQTACH